MSFFGEANEDSYSVAPDAAATGPLVGFFESWKVAVDAQMRASSQFGIEYFMHELDDAQARAMQDAGVENPPRLNFALEGVQDRGEDDPFLRTEDGRTFDSASQIRFSGYMDVARQYANGGMSEAQLARLREYDAQIAKLRDGNPNLKLMTSQEMFERVRSDAQAAEARLDGDRRSWGGAFGGFFGGALASLHPETDPFNFFTLGVGGAGKTALTRIGAQVGAQGMIEAVNQVTGVQESREILGLSHGFADAAGRVAGTAVGAGALQGVGEVAGMAARRWFRNTPTDRAPEPTALAPERGPLALPKPEQFREEAQSIRLEADGRAYTDLLAEQSPLSGIRVAAPRIATDIADMTRQLEAWDSAPPATLSARTANAVMPERRQPTNVAGMRAALDNNRLYQMAKEADPQTFRQYERLLERRNTYRRWIEELNTQRDADVQAAMDGIERKLHSLDARLRTTQGKNNKAKIKQEIKAVQADREALLKASEARETPDTARVRRELMRNDEKMRDIAPLVGRAYSRARGRWGETAQELDAVWDAYRAGKAQPDMETAGVLPDYDTAMMSLADRAPVLQRANTVERGATSADTARAVLADNAKVLDEALETYREEIKRLVDVSGTTVEELTPRQMTDELNAKFGQDAVAHANDVKSRVKAALDAGGRVFVVAEGKDREIVSVSNLGMVDRNGNAWGVTALLMAQKQDMDVPALRIEMPGNRLRIEGREYEFDLDKDTMFVPHDEGTGGREVTMREFLEDTRKSEDELEAVSLCSTR